jgi:Gluconate 2-dehydrogenase subunit 3
MERRQAIKGIALSLGSMVSLPAWALSWQASALHTTAYLSTSYEDLLAELVDTFIPKTDTFGAKDLGVHQFIQTMLTDCYTPKAQIAFAEKLSELGPLSINSFGKSFAEGNAEQRLNLLKSLAESTDKGTRDFYQTLRSLTIKGYTSSEYFMTKFTDYEIAPARFYGCVPVKK